MTAKKKSKRVRRNADDARREILDTAETMLREHGPDGIRLQQLADVVGVSHPAILHHFGSREGLIAAVVHRAVARLEADMIDAIASAPSSEKPLGAQLIDRAYDVLVKGGHARVAAWLLLSGHWNPEDQHIRTIARASHVRRLELEGDVTPPATLEDTTFRVILVGLTIFGEAIAGNALRHSAGLTDPDAPDRFREWLARLLIDSE